MMPASAKLRLFTGAARHCLLASLGLSREVRGWPLLLAARPDFTAAQLDYKQLQNADRQAKARPMSSGASGACLSAWQVDFFELLLAKAALFSDASESGHQRGLVHKVGLGD